MEAFINLKKKRSIIDYFTTKNMVARYRSPAFAALRRVCPGKNKRMNTMGQIMEFMQFPGILNSRRRSKNGILKQLESKKDADIPAFLLAIQQSVYFQAENAWRRMRKLKKLRWRHGKPAFNIVKDINKIK